MGFLSFYESVRGFTVADQDLQQTFHQASFVLLLMPACSLNLGCARQSTANSPLADVIPSNGHTISKYSNKFSPLPIYLHSNPTKKKKNTARLLHQHVFLAATLQPCLQSCSQPWRVLFLERQPRLRHFESHRVRDSWAEALWTQNEDDWMWGWLCSPRAIVCTNHAVFTLWGLFISEIEKKGPCGFLFIPLQNNYHITR